jgi:TPR repeat protein
LQGLYSRLKPLPQFFILLASAPVSADYQTGLEAYQEGDYERAMAEWKEEVNRPRVQTNLAVYREALYAIAMLYWKGEGVGQDYSIAAVWLKQAADINHPGAQVKLGYLYSTGQGVPLNYQEARRWLQMAAVQGDRDAAHNLDILDRERLGWPEDSDQPGPAGESKPDIPAVASAASAPAVAPAEPPATTAMQGEDWIRAQNPEHYTIQVIALRTPDNLHAFIAEHADWEPFAIYRPAGKEKPLWVLVQGVYTDVDAARAAAAAFPPGIQRPKELWIRKFAMVQDLIE